MDARETYLQNVYPRLKLPLAERYPLASLESGAGRHPLAHQAMLMLVALTATGKSTALELVRARLAGMGAPIIPSRRELADWIAIPLAQSWADEPLTPLTDRVQRFQYTRRFAQRVPGGMAAAFSWLQISDEYRGLALSEGLRGDNEIGFALGQFPRWRIVELALRPLTRLRRLSARQQHFDQAEANADLSFLPQSIVAQAQALVAAGEISAKALAIVRAEAANYGLNAFTGGAAFPQYHRLDVDGCPPESVADAIIEIIERHC